MANLGTRLDLGELRTDLGPVKTTIVRYIPSFNRTNRNFGPVVTHREFDTRFRERTQFLVKGGPFGAPTGV